MVSLTALEAAQRRTLISGVRPDVTADFAQVMADMRDQGLDPLCGIAALLVGPYPSDRVVWQGRPLERAVLVVADSQPHIEFEVELLAGLISQQAWSEERMRHWIPTRYVDAGAWYPFDQRSFS